MKLRFWLSMLGSAVAVSVFGWGDAGHMTIAAIAKKELKPGVLAEAERLIKLSATEKTPDFISAASWADDVRRDRPESATWHYMDIHFRADGKPSTNAPDKENASTAIAKFSAILSDKTKSDLERAEALRYIIHFVGDIHQPLHGSARDTDEHPKGDRGGNDFHLEGPANVNGKKRTWKNLHSAWDSGVGLFPFVERPLSTKGLDEIDALATKFTKENPRSSYPEEKDSNPTHWAVESSEVARKVAYNIQENTIPTGPYIVAAQAASERRATLAGYRLADLLNKLIKN